MNHNFSNSEIIQAWTGPALDADEDYPPASLEHIRAFLAALPEPQDDWEECSTGDLLMTDRFKVEGPGWKYEGEVKQLDATIICHNPRNGQPIYASLFDADDDLNLYRIPAPVQHPDPEEHPYIFDEFLDVPWFALEDGRYMHPKIVGLRPPESFGENWTPADIVPKVVADDDPVRPEDVGF